MFHTMRNRMNRGTGLTKRVLNGLRERLPKDWELSLGEGVLIIRGPNGDEATVEVLSFGSPTPQEVLRALSDQTPGECDLIVMVPFASERLRELLEDRNVNYGDETGNFRFVLAKPTVLVRTEGLDSNPNRTKRSLQSLKGGIAGRVVRALVDFKPPYGVRRLASLARVPPSTASRVVSYVEQQALISRDSRKEIRAVDWPALIREWARHYDVAKSNSRQLFLAPRGISDLVERTQNLDRYAATGSLASQGYAPTRLAMLYVDDAEDAATTLDLDPVSAGANVWLLEPYDDVVFERTQTVKTRSYKGPPLIVASPSQVLVDLMTSPGRGPSEAEVLMEKLKSNEWQRTPRP